MLNRLSLRIQYRLSNHIFVHSEKMKLELVTEFSVPASKVTVIPFGINSTLPSKGLTTEQARRELGLGYNEKVLLFFGQIAPYKGLEYLVEALDELNRKGLKFRLIIAGRVKSGYENYWGEVRDRIARCQLGGQILSQIRHIPDEDVEAFFKAADVAVLPYVNIFQSGVPFLAYNFGLPVIATDVGSLREDVLEGQTGFVCKPLDSSDLARTVVKYFSSGLYSELHSRRPEIRAITLERHSWNRVGELTANVYRSLALHCAPKENTCLHLGRPSN